MDKETAKKLANLQVDALWISNNGGRVSDSLPSSISVLKSIVKSVRSINNKTEIYFDGGIRGGTDVLKALAYGA